MIKLGTIKLNNISKSMVNKVLDMNMIGQSEVIQEFENVFAEKIGSDYAVAVSNGTMADTIALAALKNLYPGQNEVILPALTFAAQLNSVLHNGLKPVFYDDFYHIGDLINKKTLCIFPVHLLGEPIDITSLKQMCDSFKVHSVEDACEALGSKYELAGVGSYYVGTLGDMGTFSFFPSHTITTGEGGMIVTNDKDLYELCKKLRNHGRSSEKDFHFDVVGFNGKMTSMQAAVGLGMMQDFDEIVKRKMDNLKKFSGFDAKFCPHGFSVQYQSEKERNEKLELLRKNNIECRNLFSCLPTQEKAYEFLGYRKGEFPLSENKGETCLYVPCHQDLNDEDIEKIKSLI